MKGLFYISFLIGTLVIIIIIILPFIRSTLGTGFFLDCKDQLCCPILLPRYLTYKVHNLALGLCRFKQYLSLQGYQKLCNMIAMPLAIKLCIIDIYVSMSKLVSFNFKPKLKTTRTLYLPKLLLNSIRVHTH